MEIGIIGLPNAGKSTLFKALTGNEVNIEAFPFSTVNPNIGVVAVPDERLKVIADIIKPDKVIPAFIKFYDIAGLVKGASKGEGLGNKFLSEIRATSGIVEVVRCFKDESVAHVEGEVDPVRDIEIVHLEIVMSDLEIVERNLEKISHAYKSGKKELKHEYEALSFARETLNKGKWLREEELREEWIDVYKNYNLLTIKPLIIVGNIGEDELIGEETEEMKRLKEFTKLKGYPLIFISCKLEAEIVNMDEKEKKEFLSDIGIKETGLEKLIKESYKLLDLITFFTYANNILQAWAIKRGTLAPQAAGKIHSDMEKGFIKAEVINFEDIKRVNSLHQAREKGLIKIEGREYVVQDGDIIYFKFNV